jgi:hypothetical protein
MANPIPCGRCNDVADADLLVTDRTPEFTLLGVPTTGLCVLCYINHAMELANAIQASMAEIEAQPDAPGVLESVEADEGKVEAADPLPPAPKRRQKAEQTEGPAGNLEEATAADVNG